MLCVVLLSLCISACAQGEGMGLAGRNELMAAGAWAKVSGGGGDVKATLIGVDYGKFVDNNIELQLAAIYGSINLGNTDIIGSDSGTFKAWLLGPAAVYHFMPKNKPASTVPYVGVGALWAHASGLGESDSSLKLQYMLGVKFFVGGDSATANKTVFLEYRHTNVDMFDTNLTLNGLWSGVSVLF
jgi:outer membrane protein W